MEVDYNLIDFINQFSGRFLSFMFSHPISQKKGVLTNMMDKVFRIKIHTLNTMRKIWNLSLRHLLKMVILSNLFLTQFKIKNIYI